MKVQVTTTETKTSEVNVSFPAFTKTKKTKWYTVYHAVFDETKMVMVSEYEVVCGSISTMLSVTGAFDSGFEFIDEAEFRNAILRVRNGIIEEANSTLATLDSIKQQGREDHERDEYFEALDTDRAELEESLAETEFVDY
jgi:predicted transcriptional regulator